MTIGVAITTHNRPNVFKQTYEKIKEFLPEGARLVVVDDASDIPVKESTFRFEQNVGIAAAKNKCLELLEGCDYLFLFDDDTYAKVKNWHLPYISSGLNHAMMIFHRLSNGTSTNNKIIKKTGGLVYYKNPCGNMLFFTKKCLQIVGGMDEGYGKWGGEHQGLSERIFNNGLTPHPFIDVQDSIRLFYSHDYYLTCERSVSSETRKQQIKHIMPKLQSEKGSKEFIPYRKMSSMIITTYFTGFEDPQRGEKWTPNTEDIDPLFLSVIDKSDSRMVVLTDSFPYLSNGIKADFINVECTMNPYLQRWISILEYFKEVKEDYVFCVDATDVQMINNPFKENLGNYLWVGDEPSTIKNEWLLKHHNVPLFKSFFKTHAHMPLLNAGVIGGRKSVVEAFLKRLVWFIENEDVGGTDMAIFNYVLYTEFKDQIRHGRKVTNVFKSYQTTGTEWFSHK